MSKTTVLVTGGCGFIGSHITEALVQKGYKVRILDNLSTGKLENIAAINAEDIEVLVGDQATSQRCQMQCRDASMFFMKQRSLVSQNL